MDRHLTNALFMFVEPFATAPGPLKCCNTPQSEVPMRAVIYVEDI